MKTKTSFYVADVVIVLSVIAVSVVGSTWTQAGLDSWYSTINLPSFTPPGQVIGLVWTTIFVLTAIAAIRAWRRVPKKKKGLVFGAFVVNGILNAAWTYIFFVLHEIGWAVVEAGLLGLSVVALMALLWKHDQVGAWLLVPYAVWVSFATYLTYTIYQLN